MAYQKNIFFLGIFIPLLIFSMSFKALSPEYYRKRQHFIHHIQHLVPQLMSKYSIPGSAVAIIDNYQIVSIKGYGFANRIEHYPITLGSIFQVGSVSKTVTAWGVLKLVEEEKIQLNDPVEKYLTRWHLPEISFNREEVTIERVLNHTSGLSVTGYPGYSVSERMPTLVESLNGLQIIQPPGKSFRYSGGGYTLLQLMIEEVTKKRFQDYMRSEILVPLGMLNSSFDFSDYKHNISRSYGHFTQEQPPYFFTEAAAAGLYTTIKDLTAFALNNLKALDDNLKEHHLLSFKTVSKMIQGNRSYGLGYGLEKLSDEVTLVYHTGANRGWRSGLFLLPKLGSGLIILTNSDYGSYLIEDISNSWLDWKINAQMANYQSILAYRRGVSIATILWIILLMTYLTFFTKQLIAKRRFFTTKLSEIFTIKKAIFIITFLLFISAWWVLFYTSIYAGKWVIGTFMPAGFELLTLVMSGSLLVIVSLHSFSKKTPI